MTMSNAYNIPSQQVPRRVPPAGYSNSPSNYQAYPSNYQNIPPQHSQYQSRSQGGPYNYPKQPQPYPPNYQQNSQQYPRQNQQHPQNYQQHYNPQAASVRQPYVHQTASQENPQDTSFNFEPTPYQSGAKQAQYQDERRQVQHQADPRQNPYQAESRQKQYSVERQQPYQANQLNNSYQGEPYQSGLNQNPYRTDSQQNLYQSNQQQYQDDPVSLSHQNNPQSNPYTNNQANPYQTNNHLNAYETNNQSNSYQSNVQQTPYQSKSQANNYQTNPPANPYRAEVRQNPYQAKAHSHPDSKVLPPKIPVISASPSVETLSSTINQNNSINNETKHRNRDPFSRQSYRDDNSSKSTQSMDDLIDRYIEGVNIKDDRKKPPYPKEEEHQNSSSQTSLAKTAPYPNDDPLISTERDQSPKRVRRYTDELLDELKNQPIQAPVTEQPVPQTYGAASGSDKSQILDPVQDFIDTRNAALQDYKTFTLEIQFKWAKTLLDAINSPPVVSTVNINGHRANMNSNEMKKNQITFLNTSLKVLKKLSEIHDDPKSQAMLGDLYSGYSLTSLMERNIKKGFGYYLMATKGKSPNATYKVGCCVEHGIGTKADPVKAFHFYKKAALLGDPDAMCKLGLVYIKGLLAQPKSAKDSIYWLNKAIAVNDTAVLPIYILAKIYETDVTTLNLKPHKNEDDAIVVKELARMQVYQNYKTAVALFLKAAKLGHIKSQSHLGYCYEYGSMGCTVDPKMSIYWYSKAAAKGDATSEMGLSGWYLTGSEGLLQQSDSEAFLWARKASEKGLPKAEYALGYFNEVGVGTKKNLVEARRWYKMAASQGHTKAIKKLEGLR